ncbi:MAG: hypothetical protein J6T60_05840 [Bacteroidales bacterium]|nr:hypothetical protein [Bacteroidales bacterium]
MKRFISFIIRHPFSLIIPGIALCCLDIKPLGVLLLFVGGIIYLIKHFNNRNNDKGDSSGLSTSEQVLLLGD